MALLGFRRTQISKTGIGQTFDTMNDGAPDTFDNDDIDADFTMPPMPSPFD
jgi:hypothetical protein